MPQTDGDRMVRFSCPKCGRQMQARAEYTGRTTRCPGCQHQLAIPDLTAASPAPAPRAASGPSRAPRAALVGLAVVALLAGAVAAWRLWPRGADSPGVDDLALLPANAQAVMTLRVAEVLDRPAGRKALAQLREKGRAERATELERALGLRLADVERASVVVIDNDDELGYGVVKTARPYNRAGVLERLRGATEHTHRGQSYFAGQAGAGPITAAAFPGPRVVVLGPERGVQRALEVLAAPVAEGPLAPAIQLARGAPLGVIGLNPSAGKVEGLRREPALAFLADVKSGVGTLEGGEKWVLDLRLAMPDEEGAERLRAKADGSLGPAQFMIRLMKPRGGRQAKGLELADKLLGDLKISREGAEVRGRVETDEETAAALVALAMSFAAE
jgi:hypothetical protein